MPNLEPDPIMESHLVPRTPGAQGAVFWSRRGSLEGLALSIPRMGLVYSMRDSD